MFFHENFIDYYHISLFLSYEFIIENSKRSFARKKFINVLSECGEHQKRQTEESSDSEFGCSGPAYRKIMHFSVPRECIIIFFRA